MLLNWLSGLFELLPLTFAQAIEVLVIVIIYSVVLGIIESFIVKPDDPKGRKSL